MNEDAELVKSYYDAFNNKNFAHMLSLLDDNVVHDLNQGKPQIGIQSFGKFMDHMNNCFDEYLEELQIMTGEEGRVAAEFYVRGNYLKTDGELPAAHGQKYRIRAGAFLETKNGKITRVTTYYNLPEWIMAVNV